MQLDYAGFWQRVAAALLDWLILGIPAGIGAVVLLVFLPREEPQFCELPDGSVGLCDDTDHFILRAGQQVFQCLETDGGGTEKNDAHEVAPGYCSPPSGAGAAPAAGAATSPPPQRTLSVRKS